jgi:hypothetical protein
MKSVGSRTLVGRQDASNLQEIARPAREQRSPYVNFAIR